MIVRPHQGQLLVMTQPDHAAVSALLLGRWMTSGFPAHPRRDSILLATAEHDAGWAPEDAAPMIDPQTGRLLDFVHVPHEVRQRVWPVGVERLARTPYAAALVAQHAIHVYRTNRDQPDWASFFHRMEQLRDHHLARTPHTLAQLLADYTFVRFGDLVSLVFANDWREPRVEGDTTFVAADGAVLVSPDPFNGEPIPFTMAGRLLPDRPFDDDADAAAALQAAPLVTLSGTAAGS